MTGELPERLASIPGSPPAGGVGPRAARSRPAARCAASLCRDADPDLLGSGRGRPHHGPPRRRLPRQPRRVLGAGPAGGGAACRPRSRRWSTSRPPGPLQDPPRHPRPPRRSGPSTASRSPSAPARPSAWRASPAPARRTVARTLVRINRPTGGSVRLAGAETRRLQRPGPPGLPPPHADGLPGPLRLPRPPDDHPRGHRRGPGRPRRGPGRRRAETEDLLAPGQPARHADLALPRPAVRRPAPAGVHRPRPGRRPRGHRLRRGRGRAGRVHPGPGAQPAQGHPGRRRGQLPVHLPRPVHAAVHGRPGRHHVRRPAGRVRHQPPGLQRAAAPLHPGPDRRRARRVGLGPRPRGPRSPASRPTRPARRPAARSTRAARPPSTSAGASAPAARRKAGGQLAACHVAPDASGTSRRTARRPPRR